MNQRYIPSYPKQHLQQPRIAYNSQDQDIRTNTYEHNLPINDYIQIRRIQKTRNENCSNQQNEIKTLRRNHLSQYDMKQLKSFSMLENIKIIQDFTFRDKESENRIRQLDTRLERYIVIVKLIKRLREAQMFKSASFPVKQLFVDTIRSRVQSSDEEEEQDIDNENDKTDKNDEKDENDEDVEDDDNDDDDTDDKNNDQNNDTDEDIIEQEQFDEEQIEDEEEEIDSSIDCSVNNNNNEIPFQQQKKHFNQMKKLIRAMKKN